LMTPPVGLHVATKFEVLAVPTFCSAKLIVTISDGINHVVGG